MKLYHPATETYLAQDIKWARSFRERLIGLMFVSEMKGFDGLVIEPCNSIHNCFVRFSIDVIFVDRDFKVVSILRGFRPWRFSRIYFSAKKVIELKKGAVPPSVKVGDQLEVRDV